MATRCSLCLSAVAAVLFLSGSIKIRSVNLESMEIGGVTVDGKWKTSSPTVQSADGEYLAYEVDGQSPRVYFTTTKGPHTAWAFVDQKPFTDHSINKRKGTTLDESGFTLRLRTTAGPFRGWYLTRTKEGKLALTKESGRAAEVRMLLKREEYRFQ